MDEPFGEFDDYLRHYNYVKFDKSDTEFSPPSRDDYAKIKRRLFNIVDVTLAQKHDSPKYDDI